MPKVQHPLHSGDVRGQFGGLFTFKRGGIVTSYFRPTDPQTAGQLAIRELFRRRYVALTQEQADLLYSAITHLHDDRYQQLSGVAVFPVWKTAIQTVNFSAAVQDDTELFVALAAGERAALTLLLQVQAASVDADIKFTFSAPDGATGRFSAGALVGGVGSGSAASLLTEFGSALGRGASAGVFGLTVYAWVQNADVAGNVRFRWAQITAMHEDLSILPGSCMVVAVNR